MTATTVAPGVGPLLREWRNRRRRSQLDLSLEVGVSTRHLSFVETGRSTPSPELVLAVADHLDVPFRERNTLLLAAGYAPRYRETSLDDESMAQVRASLQRMLDAHDPYPGVVIDRQWNVVLSNLGAAGLLDGIPAELLSPTINVFRLCLHPDGLARRTDNLGEWAAYLLRQLDRAVALSGDPALAALAAEVRAYPTVRDLDVAAVERAASATPTVLVPLTVRGPAGPLSFFTTLATLGTPNDITLDELSIELFYPADSATETALR
ncbi:MAG: helix-turn-helix domain-containing protein [Acidimicrobiales bacterium]